MTVKTLPALLDKMWLDYININPLAKKISDVLTREGEEIQNDHIALRTFNHPRVSVDVLAKLSERLLAMKVVPYYLHQLDRVTGAAHFEVPLEEGHAIIAELRRRLPGYAVPRYVKEWAGEAHKRVLA